MSDTRLESQPRQDLHHAIRLREAGRFAEARRELEVCLAQAADDPAILAELAHTQVALGDLAAAQATAARLPPGSAAALRTAARIQLRLGQAASAAASAKAALAADPEDSANALVLAQALAAAGEADAAARVAQEVLARDPGRGEAHVVLAQLARRRGDTQGEAAAVTAALALKAHLPLWASLGALQLALGRAEEAVSSLRRGLEAHPRDVQALVNLGEAERQCGRPAAAEPALREAVAQAPGQAAAWINLGAVLQQQGRAEAAREAYDRALAIDPNDAGVMVNLARILADAGRFTEAENLCRKALNFGPALPQAHYALGGVLRAAGRVGEAEACYRTTLDLQPDFYNAKLALADVLREGLRPEAATLLEELLVERGALDVLLPARLSLTPIPDSVVQIEAERARFASGLEEALAWPSNFEDPSRITATSRFYLAYHGRDDRPLLEAMDRLARSKAPELGYMAPHRASRTSRRDGRIRVAFVSQFFSNHTIGRLYRGIVAGLDRSRFQVVAAFFPRTARDAARDAFAALADEVIELSAALDVQRPQLEAADLDVLLYPDVGMSAGSLLLPRARLAPVQVASWGHPETTGMASIDYFLSGDSFEPEGAEAHYTERLIRLGRLPCVYEAIPEDGGKDRQALGLPDGRLYGCPQSLFKLHPEFDAVLASIVEGDPAARLVFVDGTNAHWREALRLRWARVSPRLLESAVFLPRLRTGDFMSLLAHVDVLLDPPHFGSGNTLYEAMWTGTPVVTWPGEFARGRIVAGAYQQMGVGGELIVPTLGDYAKRAIEIANDRPRRAALGAELKAAARRELFGDTAALRQIEGFLTAAVEAADRGERLASGWRPQEAAR